MTYGQFLETEKRKKVLVVDDNRMNLALAKRLIERYGPEVDTATDGAKALEMMKKAEYAIVFMDYLMPEMDGVETTREIRRLELAYCKEVPVVALTANTEMEDCRMLEMLGFCEYLAKPLTAVGVEEVIRKYLGVNCNETQSAEEQVSATSGEMPEIEGIDAVGTMKKNGFDKATYLSILKTWHEDLPMVLKQALTAKMREDLARFTIEVHSLKSSGAGVGAMELSELAKCLEAAGKAEDMEYINAHMMEFVGLCKQTEQILDAFFAEEEESVSGAGEKLEREWLEAMAYACDEMESEEIAQLLKQMQGKRLRTEDKELLQKIRGYAGRYDYEEAAEAARRGAEERQLR